MVFLPDTRLRHNLNEFGFKLRRINRMTLDSSISNCCFIASKGVLSSQAISMILETSSVLNCIVYPPVLSQYPDMLYVRTTLLEGSFCFFAIDDPN
ncbi:hypothetical protein A3737_25745 [Oleiphilus sp. HI0065]|nr:hypothetical protein A3737_25745 [Oleiphilus sp. HI0065]